MTARMANPSQRALKRRDPTPKEDFSSHKGGERGVEVVRSKAIKSSSSAASASEIDPDLKFMFITGFAAVVLNSENQPPKEARVLSKPFHLKDLVREVDRLLAA